MPIPTLPVLLPPQGRIIMSAVRGITTVIVLIALAGCGKTGDARTTKTSAITVQADRPVPAELQTFSDRCRMSSTGTILGLQALLSARHHPGLAGIRRMNLGGYCSCYYSGLQRAVGTERAVAYTSAPEQMEDVPMIETSDAADEVRIQCVEALAPAAGTNPFTTLFTADFLTGRGIGGVEIGMSVAALRQRLGETNLISRGKSDKYRYGDNGIELVVEVFPSGEGGQVASVLVNHSYQGATDRGIRMGDSYASVEAKHTDIVFRADKRSLLCADGTKYIFTESGFLSDIAVVTAEVDPLMKFYGGR